MTDREKIERLKKQIELETTEERKTRLAKACQDPDRPQYHFQPSLPSWMNDPHGPLFWKGNYHLFYQYHPGKPYPGQGVCWGHAVSEDLIHWSELPIALTPTPDGPDRHACWTGMAVDNDGVPTIIYTGVAQYMEGGYNQWTQVQCLATSKDEMLITWEKYKGNPVISHPPKGMVVTGFRDPYAWKEDDTWYLIIGSGIKDVGGTSLLYKSKDLIHWEYIHPFYTPDADRLMHECPDFFPLGNKYVLITSWRGSHWDVGAYTEHKFIPEKHGMTDWGNYYAATAMTDERGRRIIWGVITEGRSWEEMIEAGWRGALSLPRMVSLLPDNTLQIKPVPELEVLRGNHWTFKDLELVPSDNKNAVFLEGVQGDCIEVVVRFAANHARMFGLIVKGTDEITYDREKQKIAGTPLALGPEEDLTLQVYVDRSIIEVFANDRVCKTLRTYHNDRDNLGVGVFSENGKAKVKSVDIWEMKSIKA